jgi:hypothetical protein
MAFYTPADLANKQYVAKMTSSQRGSALAWSQGQVSLAKKDLAIDKTEYTYVSQATNTAVANAAAAKAAFDKNPTNATAQANYNKLTAAAVIKKAELSAIVQRSATTLNEITQLEKGISTLKAAGATANPARQPSTTPAKTPIVPATPVHVGAWTATPVEAPTIAAPPSVDESAAETARLTIQNQKLVDAENAQNEQDLAVENARLANRSNNRAIEIALENTRSQAAQQDAVNFQQEADWRVRLSLAPGATYLYKDPQIYQTQSILLPLLQTDGVIFPYTPAITVSYNANYAATDPTHSNYSIYSYTNSKVSEITIGCDFTAQDIFEANYLLAVIHFFRSATKMFYGQDENPRNGTPPPLCYLTGLGAFQFDQHPLAIKEFTYTLPIDVDYIRAGIPTTDPGVNKAAFTSKQNSGSTSGERLDIHGLTPGGGTAPPKFNVNYSSKTPTYVPTKISLSITAVPIITRNLVSNDFSLNAYATGKLLRGSTRLKGGGFW